MRLRKEGPGRRYDLTLPTVTVEYEGKVRMGFAWNQYHAGGYSIPFALWNYVFKNVGKVVGFVFTLPVLVFTLPYSLIAASVHSVYDYVNKKPGSVAVLPVQANSSHISDNSDGLNTGRNSTVVVASAILADLTTSSHGGASDALDKNDGLPSVTQNKETEVNGDGIRDKPDYSNHTM